MHISVKSFGKTPDGRDILLYLLENNHGMRVGVLNYGGIIHTLEVPDQNGALADIVLGYNTLEEYFTPDMYFGCVVGRNANRVSQAHTFILDKAYSLQANSGTHHLHGGSGGLSFHLFRSEVHTFNNLPVLLLNTTLPDLSDGLPGNLTVNLIYALTDDNALMIDYRAVSDKDTAINLTNHSYFNLAGHSTGPVYGHMLQIEAPFYTPADAQGIPTGEILQVAGSPLDFTTAKPIGKDIGSSYPQIQQFGGYDHNFVLAGSNYRRVATVTEPVSGRVMNIFTDLPGAQLYTANSLDTARTYKDGATYARHQGFCFETQIFPNAVNTPWFPSPIFSAGEEYSATTTFQFSTQKADTF